MTRRKLLLFIKKNPLGLSLTLHVALFVAMLIMPSNPPQTPERIEVQTVQLKSPKPLPKQASHVRVKKAPIKKKVAPLKKVPAKKPSKPAPKPTKSLKPKPSVGKPAGKNVTSSKKPVRHLPSFISKASQTTLLQMLEKCLELPELGKVTLELTVNSKGSITDVKVLGSESKKNEAYLLSALKKISLAKLKLKDKICVVVEFGNAR